MKNGNHLPATLVIAFAIFLAADFPAVAQSNQTISKKEVRVLLKTARLPADHEKIAAYYRQEAARLTASAKEHRELAAIYQRTPSNAAMEAKHGASVEGASHCRRWAELGAEQAKEAEALAVLHEGMAKESAEK